MVVGGFTSWQHLRSYQTRYLLVTVFSHGDFIVLQPLGNQATNYKHIIYQYILHGRCICSLDYFLFQPVVQNWSIKGRGMYVLSCLWESAYTKSYPPVQLTLVNIQGWVDGEISPPVQCCILQSITIIISNILLHIFILA